MNGLDLRNGIVRYIRSMQCGKPCLYRISDTIDTPILYATTYAVMALHLFGELKNLPDGERCEVGQYIRSCQSDDGLFRDEAVKDSPYVDEDWWGWRHLTCHALIALAALGERADREIAILEPLYDPEAAHRWIASRAWDEKPDFVSNEVMNRMNMLQYMRDFFGKKEAARALDAMYAYLDDVQDEGTGLWGPPFHTQQLLSRGVQTAYHLWELYFYDKRPVKYIDRAIDSCLAMQNASGGYGARPNSSACEDIDSIAPLVRFSFLTDYRRGDIVNSLERVFQWVMTNRNEDGGFVFLRDEPIELGHRFMRQETNQSILYTAWWRPLALAYMSKVIHNEVLDGVDWQFINCPGYHFWNF